VRGQVRVAAARFYSDPEAGDDAWRQWQVGESIARHLRRRGKASFVEPGLLVWYERKAERSALTEGSLPVVSGGLLSWVGSSVGDGPEALQVAARAGLLGRDIRRATLRSTTPPDLKELRATFGRMFRSGIVYATDEPIPPGLDALPGKEKRAALADAMSFVKELRSRRPRSRLEATAACVAGELRVVFLVSSRAPRHLRSRWEALVRCYNLQVAIVPARAPKSRTRGHIQAGVGTPAIARRRRIRPPEPVAAVRAVGSAGTIEPAYDD
jgi:hypothetical protein